MYDIFLDCKAASAQAWSPLRGGMDTPRADHGKYRSASVGPSSEMRKSIIHFASQPVERQLSGTVMHKRRRGLICVYHETWRRPQRFRRPWCDRRDRRPFRGCSAHNTYLTRGGRADPERHEASAPPWSTQMRQRRLSCSDIDFDHGRGEGLHLQW